MPNKSNEVFQVRRRSKIELVDQQNRLFNKTQALTYIGLFMLHITTIIPCRRITLFWELGIYLSVVVLLTS